MNHEKVIHYITNFLNLIFFKVFFFQKFIIINSSIFWKIFNILIEKSYFLHLSLIVYSLSRMNKWSFQVRESYEIRVLFYKYQIIFIDRDFDIIEMRFRYHLHYNDHDDISSNIFIIQIWWIDILSNDLIFKEYLDMIFFIIYKMN